MLSIETKLKNWLIVNNPSLNVNKIKRHANSEHAIHLRFSAGCGITSSVEFVAMFKTCRLQFAPCSHHRFSKSYSFGGYVTFNGAEVGVLYGIAPPGGSERKRWTPKSCNLTNQKFTSPAQFRTQIINGISKIERDSSVINMFTSILDNIETGSPIIASKFLQVNKSKITSDFGEIMAAYKDCCDGNEIMFPLSSASKVFDYYVLKSNKKIPVSVKNIKGGGKVNLSYYAELIAPYSTVNNAGKVLYAIATHDREGVFKYAAQDCIQVKKLLDIIGGYSVERKAKYVATHTYDEFYNQIKNDPQFFNLGVPLSQHWKNNELTPRSQWEDNCLDPVDFTINTIISKFWGKSHSIEITKIVSTFFSGPKFMIVDIVDQQATFNQIKFEEVDEWQTVYWSRATKAWHNWMAVEPKEIKARNK